MIINRDNKKVLLIDDDLSIRFVLRKIINRLFKNVDVFSSSDTVEGLGYIFLLKSEVVIIDTTLPSYGGLEVLDYISSNKKLKQLNPKVIVLYKDPKYLNTKLGYTFIHKKDKQFLDKLINALGEKLHFNNYSENISFFNSLKSIGSQIIQFSDKSNLALYKILHNKYIVSKIINSIKWLVNQLVVSFYLAVFYVLGGNKVKELNIEQNEVDLKKFRFKTYPTIAMSVATILILLFQIGVFLGSFLALKTTVFAATRTWDGGGADNNWSTCANWSLDTCPVAADTVQFNGTSTKDSVVDGGFGGTLTSIVIASGYTGTISQARSLTITGTFTQSAGNFTAANQTFDVDGAFTLNSGGNFTASSGNSFFGANFVLNSGSTFTHNNGTITFDAAGGGFWSCNNTAFNLVVLSAGGIIQSDCSFPLGNNPTLTMVSNIILNGTLSGTGTLTKTDSTLTLNTGSVLSGFSGLSVVGFEVQGATANFGSYSTFQASSNVLLASGSLTLPNGAFIGGALTIDGGTFNAPSGNMTIIWNFTINSGTFNANGGTIIATGGDGGDWSCNNATFNLVQFTHDAATTKVIHNNCIIPVGNNPTSTGGLEIDGATFTGSGNMVVQGWLVLDNNPVFHADFDSLYASSTFGLTIQNTVDLSMFATVTVEANTQLVASADFTPPTNFVIKSNFNIADGANYNNTSNALTVFYTSTFAEFDCANIVFNNVQFGGTTGERRFHDDCELHIGNNPTIPGYVQLQGTLVGTGTLTVNGNMFVENTDLDLSTYSGVFINGTLNSFGTSLVTAPAATLHITGDLAVTSSANFDHNSGTVSFESTTTQGVSTSDSITFYNLSKISTTPDDIFGFAADTDNIILNNIIMKGSNATNALRLVSGSEDTQFRFNPQGGRDFANLFVRDSNNNSGTDIQVTGLNITNGGNNTGWNFPPLAYDPIFAYTVDPFSDDLITYNLLTGASLGSVAITLSGFTVEAGNGLATDPNTCTIYGMLKLQGQQPRRLVTIDPSTGVATLVGNTGKRFAGIAFDAADNLYGVTGDGESNLPATLYSIDKTTGAPTQIVQLNTQSGPGESIAYNPLDGFMYHFSGFDEDDQVFQKINLSNNAITNIDIDSFWQNEVFGMTYAPDEDRLIVSTTENEILRVTSSGFFSDVITVPTWIKGFAITGCVPQVEPDEPSNIGPANQTNGSTIGDNTPTFNFSINDDNEFDTVQFQIQIDDSSDFSSPIVDYTSALASQGDKNFTVGQAAGTGSYTTGSEGQVLSAGPYYWRVRGIDNGDREGDFIVANSGNVAFIIEDQAAPSNPANLGPTSLTNGSTINDSTPEFSFNLTDSNLSDTVRYRIQIDDNADFSSPLVDYTSALGAQGARNFIVGQAAGDGTYTVGNAGQVLQNGSYYWRIKAIDNSTSESSYIVANDGEIAFIVDIASPAAEPESQPQPVSFPVSFPTTTSVENTDNSSGGLTSEQTQQITRELNEQATVPLAIAVGATLATSVAILGSSVPALIAAPKAVSEVFGVFLGVFIPRKRKYWGIIYDEETNKPVSFGTVNLINKDTNKIEMTTITDLEGRYRLQINKETKYAIQVKSSGYKEFKKDINSNYFLSGGDIVADISLGRENKKRNILYRIISYNKQSIINILDIIAIFTTIIGFVMTANAISVSLNPTNIVLMAVYVILFITSISFAIYGLNLKKGVVVDIDTKNNILGAVVRIYDNTRQLTLSMTNDKGIARFNLNPGKYFILATKQGYQMADKDGSLRQNNELLSREVKNSGYLDVNIYMKKVAATQTSGVLENPFS